MKQFKIIIYALGAFTAISFFLPWLTASASSSVSGLISGSTSASASTTGIFTGQGIIGLVLLCATIYMVTNEHKWAFIPALINVIDGLILMVSAGGIGSSNSVSYSSSFGGVSASASGGLYPSIGLYMFLLGSFLIVVALLVKEFKPSLLNPTRADGGLSDAITKEDIIKMLTSDYVLALGILLFSFWLSQKANNMNNFTDFVIGLGLFVVAPYFLAKRANFKLVQHVVLAFTSIFVLQLAFSFFNISQYSYVVSSISSNHFAIILVVLAYEFVKRKNKELLPESLMNFIEKLDLKRVVFIFLILAGLLIGKEFSSRMMSSTPQQETAQDSEDQTSTELTTTESEPEIPADSAPEVAVQEQQPIENTSAQKQLYVINDPDGYTNLRATPGGKIIRKVYENETFDIIEPGEPYSKIKLTDGTVGYMHNSRITSAN